MKTTSNTENTVNQQVKLTNAVKIAQMEMWAEEGLLEYHIGKNKGYYSVNYRYFKTVSAAYEFATRIINS